jgi:hypothetical protein
VSVCTGAFLAAQAGLLDGCVATTHWAFAGQLAREFPQITVDPEPIFVRTSDRVWTAAGVTAGIDLALSLVEDDYGTEVAQTVARWLVLYLRRPGGQTQFAAPVWMPRAKRAPIRDVQEAIEAEPAGAHSSTLSSHASRGSPNTRSRRSGASRSCALTGTRRNYQLCCAADKAQPLVSGQAFVADDVPWPRRGSQPVPHPATLSEGMQ